MKFLLKILKSKLLWIFALVVLISYARHTECENSVFFEASYPKKDIAELYLLSDGSPDAQLDIFYQTGLSPYAAKEFMASGREDDVYKLGELMFKKPHTDKNYIVYPLTYEQKNSGVLPPMTRLQKGDILVSFATVTLDWRHGHLALVVDDEGKKILEHMSVGNNSVISDSSFWRKYANFAVLRYSDKAKASEAADYALEHLCDIPYSIFAGLKHKDKSGLEGPFTSHCSHIVWQAYKAVGADIDSDGGNIVSPRDVAMSPVLSAVQIYGLDPDDYKDRLYR